MNLQRLMTWAGTAAAGLGLFVFLGIALYAMQNGSGHTGVNPYLALYVFVPVTLIGVVLLVGSRTTEQFRRPGLASVLVGVVGIALLVYLDRSNTLVSYGAWARRHG